MYLADWLNTNVQVMLHDYPVSPDFVGGDLVPPRKNHSWISSTLHLMEQTISFIFILFTVCCSKTKTRINCFITIFTRVLLFVFLLVF